MSENKTRIYFMIICPSTFFLHHVNKTYNKKNVPKYPMWCGRISFVRDIHHHNYFFTPTGPGGRTRRDVDEWRTTPETEVSITPDECVRSSKEK